MKMGSGVDMILDGIVFLHNIEAFQDYILDKERQSSKLEGIIAARPWDQELTSLKRGLKIHLSWVKKDYGKYTEVYNKFYKLSHKDFIDE
ncbi:MAG: hypothetical protein R6U96_12650 [Promethearchaeia archaeon]